METNFDILGVTIVQNNGLVKQHELLNSFNHNHPPLVFQTILLKTRGFYICFSELSRAKTLLNFPGCRILSAPGENHFTRH